MSHAGLWEKVMAKRWREKSREAISQTLFKTEDTRLKVSRNITTDKAPRSRVFLCLFSFSVVSEVLVV